MDDSGLLGVVLASAAMSMIAKRKTQPAPIEEAVEIGQTNTISPETQAEIDRAPRAYRRRLIKSLRKMRP